MTNVTARINNQIRKFSTRGGRSEYVQISPGYWELTPTLSERKPLIIAVESSEKIVLVDLSSRFRKWNDSLVIQEFGESPELAKIVELCQDNDWTLKIERDVN